MKIDINSLTIGQAREIANMINGQDAVSQSLNNGMVGKYVIVRCHDAGVHAGVLESHNGRECVLTESRRLWYWKPANNSSFLSGVAECGLHSDSKVGRPQRRIHITENCEISECSPEAESSIRAQENHNE